MSEIILPQQIPGLKPYTCSYDGPDGRYQITLYGDTPESVLENNCDNLAGLAVDGEVVAFIPFAPEQ